MNKGSSENGRVMRWALFLQSFRYRIVAIRGSENLAADCMSRLIRIVSESIAFKMDFIVIFEKSEFCGLT